MRKAYLYVSIALMMGAILGIQSSAQAVSWSAAVTEGVTFVDVTLEESTNTYTWVLTNTSTMQDCPIPDSVLIWALQPFNVHEPIAWTAPDGWTWDGNSNSWMSYEIDNPDEKYYTPPAIAPGESATFTYTFDPMSNKINPYDDTYVGGPDDVGFITHIAAVVPREAPIDPELPWVPDQQSTYGQTWYDRSGYGINIVPEPGSMTALGMLGIPFAVSVIRRRRSRK